MSSPFKVLKSNEQFMVWFRIYTHPLSDVSHVDHDFFKSITVYCVTFTEISFIVSSVVLVCLNVSDNIMVALRTAMVIAGTSQALGMFLSVGITIDKVKLLHIKLQEIIDQTAKGEILVKMLLSFV